MSRSDRLAVGRADEPGEVTDMAVRNGCCERILTEQQDVRELAALDRLAATGERARERFGCRRVAAEIDRLVSADVFDSTLEAYSL
jgi:hypothetical protein